MISTSPAVTTKNGTTSSPALNNTSSSSTLRSRPRDATRSTCAAVSVGNVCSARFAVDARMPVFAM
jgi:hypothetical protein